MLKKLLVMTLVLAMGSVFSLGCKKEQPKAKVETKPAVTAVENAAKEGEKAAEKVGEAAEKAVDAATKAAEDMKK